MSRTFFIKIAGIFIIALFVTFSGFAQTDSVFLSRAFNAIEKYSSENPIEKIYLHLDKCEYFPGDTIWFKGYVVVTGEHKLSAISSVLRVEILTENDSVFSKISLPIESGLTVGDFPLSVLMPPGTYHVRAYTNWMRNFDPDYFFEQTIFVKDVQTQTNPKKQTKFVEPDIQFFPESGMLVNGLRSKVAIKAITSNGLGEDVSGSVVDEDGKDVIFFSTQHLGMGSFAFTPQSGKTYKAKITDQKGAVFFVNLSKAQESGFVITANNIDTASLLIRVAASDRLFNTSKNSSYYLIGQSGGKIYYTAYIKLSDPVFTAQIDKKRFPTGIAQFTLLVADAEPLNERCIFIQHQDQLKLQLSSAQSQYKPHQSVRINIKGSDDKNQAIVGSFSASVVNEDFISAQAPGNSIVSNLLLTSELKGFIEQPDYYFSNNDYKTVTDLDLVMLTQGYHRFEWKRMFSYNEKKVYEPENTLDLSGYVKSFGGKPLANSKVSLFTTQAGGQWLDTLTNKQGHFTFKGLIPDTVVKYSVQGRTVKDKKNLELSLDTIASFSTKKKYNFLPQQLQEMESSAYQKQIVQQLKASLAGRIIPLKEVTIKVKKEPLSGASHPDQILRDFSEKDDRQTLSQFLIPRLTNTVFKSANNPTKSLIPFNPRFPKVPMSIILDGVNIDVDVFLTLTVGDIEGVEVLRTTGNRDIVTGLENVIILTSKKHPGTNKIFLSNVVAFQSNGFYKAKAFYSPQYNIINSAINKPDLRTTVYWNPDIITDKNGEAHISFFNADTKGTYRVNVQGIDEKGHLGYQTYTYKVE